MLLLLLLLLLLQLMSCVVMEWKGFLRRWRDV